MHDTVDTNALLREMAAMRTELSLMRLELAALRGAGQTTGAVEPTVVPSVASDGVPPSEVHVTSRRHLFALASGAATAAAAVAIGSRVSPAAALNGDPILLANNGISDSTNVVTTFLNYTIPTTNTLNRNLFAVGDVSAAFTPDFPAAVSGYAGKTVSTGVSGITNKAGGVGVLGYVVPGTTDSSSIGVHGLSQAGAAVVGESASGIDL